MSIQPDALARFWRNVEQSDNCWIWIGTITRRGYGQMSIGGRSTLAHRVSAEIHLPDYTPTLSVCHTCDNPRCVRPSHLFMGEQKQNITDMVAKGRHGNQRKASCKHGHPFTPENTYIEMPKGARRCRECRKAIEAKRRVA